MNQRIEIEIRQVEDMLGYLDLMSALVPNFDYWKMQSSIDRTKVFIKRASNFELSLWLPNMKALLEGQVNSLMKDFPPKLSLKEIVEKFSSLKKTEDILNVGTTFGFLDELMDLGKLQWYPDTPFHYRIALGPLKGNGGIEEEFLLKDAFVLLKKAESNYQLLELASNHLSNRNQPDIATHRYVTDIKYEVANYSRQSVLTFFSFVECLVNSIGFDYLYRNEKNLVEEKVQALKGLQKNGRYMSLKNRIEALQTIIRKDGKIVLRVTDGEQRTEAFKSFFDQFEALRNASVHYSPIKQRIWLGPKDWIIKARTFNKVALNVSNEIWKACYPDSDGPLYMGKLDKEKQLKLAEDRIHAATKLMEHIDIHKNTEKK